MKIFKNIKLYLIMQSIIYRNYISTGLAASSLNYDCIVSNILEDDDSFCNGKSLVNNSSPRTFA